MRFFEISPHVIEDTTSKRSRLERLFNERASLRHRIAEMAETDPQATFLMTKLTRLEEAIGVLEQTMSPVQSKKARLAQLKADLADLPQNPGSQEGYDALDDIRDEIKDLEAEIKSLSEEAPATRTADNDPTIALEQAHQRALAALREVTEQITMLREESTRNARDWAYPGSMTQVAERLEEIRDLLNTEK